MHFDVTMATQNVKGLIQSRTQALSSGKERPWSELVTCHPDSGW